MARRSLNKLIALPAEGNAFDLAFEPLIEIKGQVTEKVSPFDVLMRRRYRDALDGKADAIKVMLNVIRQEPGSSPASPASPALHVARQLPLHRITRLARHDRRVQALVQHTPVRDAADVDRVAQDRIDLSPRQERAAMTARRDALALAGGGPGWRNPGILRHHKS